MIKPRSKSTNLISGATTKQKFIQTSSTLMVASSFTKSLNFSLFAAVTNNNNQHHKRNHANSKEMAKTMFETVAKNSVMDKT